MAECLDDSRLTAVASKLTPRKYIAFVDSVYDFPLRRHPWHRCFIRFVGVGMPKDEPEEFKTSSMCTPIEPCSEHPAGRESLQTSKPFPFPNCYQHSFVWATVRIPTRDIHHDDAVIVSFEERVRHEQYLSEDWAQHQALRAQQSEYDF
ncbi:hypothetical protein IEO21_10037 [Rhodonia placenta]|uniref:Uncharacterized protein n=1 Tax=Rhodonia placenta TaxID=104341 RepID=A0A8H7NT82_9APHY|nr:hypothetical protein IEO21_10037 [Postia placenta]